LISKKIPQRNSNQDKAATLFAIKSNKSDLFFNQFWEWKNMKKFSLNEKLKSFILFPKVPNTWSETSFYTWNNLSILENTKMT
jgi:hypothetical protein